MTCLELMVQRSRNRVANSEIHFIMDAIDLSGVEDGV